jgi:hypothetical protein
VREEVREREGGKVGEREGKGEGRGRGEGREREGGNGEEEGVCERSRESGGRMKGE